MLDGLTGALKPASTWTGMGLTANRQRECDFFLVFCQSRVDKNQKKRMS